MEKQVDQLALDIEYLFAHDQYLRIIKSLESRRESAISTFSLGTLSTEQLNQIAGEIRATNEILGQLGYFKAKEMQRYRQI